MRVLSAAKLLSVWEQALGHSTVERALSLLAAACPETPPEELARLSIGRRDALLMTLRELTFGSRMLGCASCHQCGETMELSFNLSQIRAPQEALTENVLSLSIDKYEVDFRLPNSEDLIPVIERNDVEAGRRHLFACCILRATESGQERAVDELPDVVRQAVVKMMAEADPQADAQLELLCPSCSHRWLIAFDIVSYFWSEINAWAYNILRDVHTLAAAYGWREEDILALSPWRRRVYLEMVGG
jgi:hypothetical protein